MSLVFRWCRALLKLSFITEELVRPFTRGRIEKGIKSMSFAKNFLSCTCCVWFILVAGSSALAQDKVLTQWKAEYDKNPDKYREIVRKGSIDPNSLNGKKETFITALDMARRLVPQKAGKEDRVVVCKLKSSVKEMLTDRTLIGEWVYLRLNWISGKVDQSDESIAIEHGRYFKDTLASLQVSARVLSDSPRNSSVEWAVSFAHRATTLDPKSFGTRLLLAGAKYSLAARSNEKSLWKEAAAAYEQALAIGKGNPEQKIAERFFKLCQERAR
jgi:hypothetical protein